VYRAFDTRRGRVVALKILAPGLEQEQDFRARFRRESDNAARLQDPHVIPIHDFGEIGGRLYIDMRLVEGTGLDDLVAAGPLSPPRAVSLIGQVAEALTDAHVHDVVHRDVKPSNILVTPTDFVYLVDFGIARALDDDHTSASDTPALIHAHLSADPPQPSLERPDVPRALDEVIARGMAKDPAARYASARDFAAAAQYALTSWGRPQHWAPPQPEPTRPAQVSTALLTEQSPPRRRRPGTAALITGALLLTAVSGGTGFALGRLDAGGAQAPTDTRTTPTSVVAAPAGPSAATPAPAAPATVDPSAAIPTAATRTGVGAPAAPATGGKRPERLPVQHRQQLSDQPRLRRQQGRPDDGHLHTRTVDGHGRHRCMGRERLPHAHRVVDVDQGRHHRDVHHRRRPGPRARHQDKCRRFRLGVLRRLPVSILVSNSAGTRSYVAVHTGAGSTCASSEEGVVGAGGHDVLGGAPRRAAATWR
jgi:serine/threonine-protein kinase